MTTLKKFDYSKSKSDIFYKIIYPLFCKDFLFGNDYNNFVILVSNVFVLNKEQWEYILDHWNSKEGICSIRQLEDKKRYVFNFPNGIKRETIVSHYEELLKHGFIDNCKDDFISAYSSLNQEFNKIVWKKSFPLLNYYISELTKLTNNKNDKWKVTASIFLRNNGMSFKCFNIRSTQGTNGIIRSDKDIDQIIKSLKESLSK